MDMQLPQFQHVLQRRRPPEQAQHSQQQLSWHDKEIQLNGHAAASIPACAARKVPACSGIAQSAGVKPA